MLVTIFTLLGIFGSILGLIIAMLSMTQQGSTQTQLLVFLVGASTIILGVVLIGFGIVIQKLAKIEKRLTRFGKASIGDKNPNS